MNLSEAILELLAPHICMQCGLEGQLLCASCAKSLPRARQFCFRCHTPISDRSLVCTSCARKTPLTAILCDVSYEGAAQSLIRVVKYENARAGCQTIARLMSTSLTPLPDHCVVVSVPTTNQRRRMRGYDQAELIARELSHLTSLPFLRLLDRTGTNHQVGANRRSRLTQVKGCFTVLPHKTLPQSVVLVDDVLTTGATLEEAARTLRRVGVGAVYATVFACTPPILAKVETVV